MRKLHVWKIGCIEGIDIVFKKRPLLQNEILLAKIEHFFNFQNVFKNSVAPFRNSVFQGSVCPVPVLKPSMQRLQAEM